MNKLSKDIYNEMLKLQKLRVKHKIITTKDEIPSFLDKAIEELNKGYIDAIIDEELNEYERLLEASKKVKRKSSADKHGDNRH